MVTSQPETVWLACVAAVRRSFVEILVMSVSVLQFMSRTSSGAESGSPAMYDSRRWFEGSGLRGSVSVDGVGRAMVSVSVDDSIVVGFRFSSSSLRFGFSRVGGIL